MRLALAILVTVVGLCLAEMAAVAHHSFAAEYDRDKPVKVTGTISKFDLTNPHSWIYVEVKGADGKTATWGFETASLIAMFRRGFKKDTLKAGMLNLLDYAQGTP